VLAHCRGAGHPECDQVRQQLARLQVQARGVQARGHPASEQAIHWLVGNAQKEDACAPMPNPTLPSPLGSSQAGERACAAAASASSGSRSPRGSTMTRSASRSCTSSRSRPPAARSSSRSSFFIVLNSDLVRPCTCPPARAGLSCSPHDLGLPGARPTPQQQHPAETSGKQPGRPGRDGPTHLMSRDASPACMCMCQPL
jgi:hypothetical protein